MNKQELLDQYQKFMLIRELLEKGEAEIPLELLEKPEEIRH